jgi:7-cyano-7-deazaguanine reductase
VLFAIPRWPSRSLLDIDKKIPLHGFDFWRAYELSWLNLDGRPEVGIGEIYFDARSENLVESKSLKLYLNSLNNESYENSEAVEELIARDLKQITQSEVVIKIQSVDTEQTLEAPSGACLDKLSVISSSAAPDATLLEQGGGQVDDVSLYSNLFRSNCPITGQPDWATFMVQYSGTHISETSLLAYLCSFRNHQSYHEECAELMFRDIMVQCEPDDLVLGLNYTRRGGIDINPFRSNHHISPQQLCMRLPRQ